MKLEAEARRISAGSNKADTDAALAAMTPAYERQVLQAAAALGATVGLAGAERNEAGNNDDAESFDATCKVDELYPSEHHFVVGKDKAGLLWDLHTLCRWRRAGRGGGSLVAYEITFRAPSQHLHNKALGGLIVHGGAQAAVVDSIAAYCGWALLDYDPTVCTAKQDFTYLKPLFVGRRYLFVAACRAEGDVFKAGRRCVVETRIFGEAEDGKSGGQGTDVLLTCSTVMVVPRRARGGEPAKL